MKRLNRREFGGMCTVSASSLLSGVVHASQTGREPVVRSNRFLTIGVDLEGKRGFVEERSTGELWEWSFADLKGASEESVSSVQGRLDAISDRLEPLSVKSVGRLENGFQLEFRETWGSFRCSIKLEPNRPEVVFSVEPDLRSSLKMGAIRFPGILTPAKTKAPALLDTVTGGRLHREPASPFILPADSSWMRFYGALGKNSSYLSILEPAFDAALELNSGQRSGWGFSWLQIPRLGGIDRVRSQRLIFLPQPSYVAVARTYRKYSRKVGLY
ncbi:MAG: hypothetical protein ACWGQW_06670, partial [bacterium]